MWDFQSDMETVKHFFSELDRKKEENPTIRSIKPEALMDADVRRAWDRLQTVKLETDMSLMDTLDDEITKLKEENRRLIYVLKNTQNLISRYSRNLAPSGLHHTHPLSRLLETLNAEIEKAEGYSK